MTDEKAPSADPNPRIPHPSSGTAAHGDPHPDEDEEEPEDEPEEKEPETPPWYTPQGDLEAQIDLEKFGWGTLTVCDISVAAVGELQATIKKGGGDHAVRNAAFLSAFVSAASDPRFPVAAGLPKWKKLMVRLPSRAADRALNGVHIFRTDVGAFMEQGLD